MLMSSVMCVQTSSGKTFTMTGTDTADGIVQYAVRDAFKHIQRHHSDVEFKVSESCCKGWTVHCSPCCA